MQIKICTIVDYVREKYTQLYSRIHYRSHFIGRHTETLSVDQCSNKYRISKKIQNKTKQNLNPRAELQGRNLK